MRPRWPQLWLQLAAVTLLVLPRLAEPRASHDLSVGSLGPDGSLRQLEYAVEASKRGGLALGIEAADAVLLVCGRRAVDPLRRDGSESDKLVRLSPSLGCAAAGLLPDSRMLVAHARKVRKRRRRRRRRRRRMGGGGGGCHPHRPPPPPPLSHPPTHPPPGNTRHTHRLQHTPPQTRKARADTRTHTH